MRSTYVAVKPWSSAVTVVHNTLAVLALARV